MSAVAVMDNNDFLASDWPQSAAVDSDHPRHWLAETAQLDVSDPKLRITSHKLTQAVQTVAGRVAAVQAYVRHLPFAAATDARTCTAGQVLRRREGDCHTKGVLFTALCRAAGIPSRLAFLDVRPRFLAGILDEGPDVMPHAVAQVHVDGQWLSTDGYVVDPVLFARAKRLMLDSGTDAGWGVIAEARGSWDGRRDCLHQFRATDIVRRHHPVHDAAQFYAGPSSALHGWAAHLKYRFAAHLVNRRVDALRRAA